MARIIPSGFDPRYEAFIDESGRIFVDQIMSWGVVIAPIDFGMEIDLERIVQNLSDRPSEIKFSGIDGHLVDAALAYVDYFFYYNALSFHVLAKDDLKLPYFRNSPSSILPSSVAYNFSVRELVEFRLNPRGECRIWIDFLQVPERDELLDYVSWRTGTMHGIEWRDSRYCRSLQLCDLLLGAYQSLTSPNPAQQKHKVAVAKRLREHLEEIGITNLQESNRSEKFGIWRYKRRQQAA